MNENVSDGSQASQAAAQPHSPLALLEQVDPISFAVVRLHTAFNDVQLGPATGFFHSGFIDNRPAHWLITNWHVLSGRNADDPLRTLHSQGALPNRLRLSLVLRADQPEYAGHRNEILMQEQTMELYDAEGKAIWYQHPRKNAIDVAVINVGRLLSDRYQATCINEVATQNDMAIQIGNEVFILGYPLGFTHFMNTPIWKRGSIASEPHLETPDSKSRVVVDATTRQGMSGGPVIMRAKTHYVNDGGQIVTCVNATRWIGVYASRPDLLAAPTALEDDRRAEIGFFYKSGAVAEVITQGIRGPDFGSLP